MQSGPYILRIFPQKTKRIADTQTAFEGPRSSLQAHQAPAPPHQIQPSAQLSRLALIPSTATTILQSTPKTKPNQRLLHKQPRTSHHHHLPQNPKKQKQKQPTNSASSPPPIPPTPPQTPQPLILPPPE